MRHPLVFSVLTLFLCSISVGAQPSSTDEAFGRAIRSLGFHALYSEARSEGTLIGLPGDAAGRLLFASGIGLGDTEREALLLVLLVHAREEPSVRERLRAVLFSRIARVSDWSLLAELLSPPATDFADTATLRRVHLEVARRILIALEGSSGENRYAAAGYEPAAVALANSARAHDSDPQASHTYDLVLAETFREIVRLSRSPDVVEALDLAARELLE